MQCITLRKYCLGCRKIGEYKWEMKKAADTAATGQCMTLCVQSVGNHAKYRSSLLKVDRFIAGTATDHEDQDTRNNRVFILTLF
jgi:hypothetical protein